MHINEIQILFNDYQSNHIHFEDLKEGIRCLLKFNLNNLKIMKHPLGFYYIKIFNANDIEEYRLHYWDKQEFLQERDLMIHNHNFELTSIILTGCIVNSSFKFLENYRFIGYLYETFYIDNCSKLQLFKSDVYCQLLKINIFSSGNIYNIKLGQYHKSIVIDNQTCITLVKTIKNYNYTPKVYSGSKYSELEFNRLLLKETEQLKLISKIIDALEHK